MNIQIFGIVNYRIIEGKENPSEEYAKAMASEGFQYQ